MFIFLRQLIISLAITILMCPTIASDYEFKTEQPIYVFGDVHGAYMELVQALNNVGIIDESGNWKAGKSSVVSLGDLLDRGSESRRVMDLLMKLQFQSQQVGGHFHVVLGNHEVMNLIGDLRYVSHSEYAEFAADEQPTDRAKVFQEYQLLTNATHQEESLQSFNMTFLDGYFARRSAISPEGYYGKWLMSLPFAIKINDHVFVHGGLSKSAANFDIQSFNQKYHDLLRRYLKSWSAVDSNNNLDLIIPFQKRRNYVTELLETGDVADSIIRAELNNFLTISSEFSESIMSPFWYRGNIICHPYYETDNIRKILQNWDANKVWVGHSLSKKVSKYLGGLVISHDTGMLKSYYQGSPYVTRIDSDGEMILFDGINGDRVDEGIKDYERIIKTYGMSDKEVEEYLEQAQILKVTPLGKGITNPLLVQLEQDGKKQLAIFKYVDTHKGMQKRRLNSTLTKSDRYQHEVAAYKLDRMLGIGRVPVTITRHIRGKSGALQIWIDGLVSANDIVDNNIPYKGFCDLKGQENMRNLFDYLIHNYDRNESNIHFSLADWKIWFIDHSRAFRNTTSKPSMMKNVELTMTPEFREALNNLTYDQVNSLSKYLTTGQIKAIMKRKEKLLNNEI